MKNGTAYRIVFDVRVFDQLGADLGSVQVVLARGITQVVGALLTSVHLGQSL